MCVLNRAKLVGLILLSCISTAYAQDRATGVGVQPVLIQEIKETVPVFAEVITQRDGSVASRVAGNVDKVHVLAGSRVEKGDLLAELNTELLEIIIAQAEAQAAEATAAISTAQVRSQSAQTNFDRISKLVDSGTVSRRQFDNTQTELLVARSQLSEAEMRKTTSQTQLAEARYRYDRSRVEAPFSGVVIEVNTIPGAFVQAGNPIIRLVDTDAFEVQASIPTRYVSSLNPGQKMSATLETGQEIDLELRAALPIEDPSTRTRAVRFMTSDLSRIKNIAVGQSVTVQVPVGEAREVLSVPKDALVQSPKGWTVFVAEDDKAQPRDVKIGIALSNSYEVISGLSKDDMVVVRGNERLRPGQSIAPNEVTTN